MYWQRENDALGLLSDDEQGGSESHHSDTSAIANKKSDRFCHYLPEKSSKNSLDDMTFCQNHQISWV